MSEAMACNNSWTTDTPFILDDGKGILDTQYIKLLRYERKKSYY